MNDIPATEPCVYTASMKKILREPLLHFVLLGVALYGLHALVRPPSPRVITVSAESVAGLEADFRRQHGRAPNADERGRLVDRHVDERVLLAEARSHRIGEGDPIVRRRLVQLMRFLLDTDASEPDAEQLRGFWAERVERYRIPMRISLEHVFAATGEAAEVARIALAAGADPGSLGDPFPHGRTIPAATVASLDDTFGAGFGAAVAAAPSGAWHGPIESSFGHHLVRVNDRLPAEDDFERVRSRVLADWRAHRQEDSVRERIAALRADYRVTVVEAP